MYRNVFVSAAVCAALGSAPVARAQTHVHPGGDSRRERYTLPAVRIDQTPRIDGALDEAVWQRAALVEDFVQ